MATRTIANGGGNWNNTGTWVEGAIPTSADDVVATGTSGNLTVPSGYAAACKTMILTNYVGLLTTNSTGSITVSGTVTLVATCTYAGTGSLIVNSSATITSNGVTWPGGFTISGTSTTLTLGDNWTITGALTLSSSGGKFNSNTFSSNGITATASLVSSGGTTKFIITGGTWSGAFETYNDVDIAGNVTISGSVAFGSQGSNVHTLKYVSGTVTTTGSTITVAGNSVTFDTNGMSLNNLTLSNSVQCTVTLNSSLTLNGTFTHAQQASTFTLTMAGTAGFTCATLKFYGNCTVNLKSSITYTITTAIDLDGMNLSMILKATTGGTRATLVINPGTLITIAKATVTDINSAGGMVVYNVNGTNSNCINWINSLTSLSHGHVE